SFRGVDVAFFSAGGSVSRQWVRAAVEAGAVVIDNTSAFRLDPDVPLVVPEVNPDAALRHHGVIANPNCSTIIMLVALNPLYREAGIERIVVSTYQRSEEHTSELQSRENLVCRLLLEKKKKNQHTQRQQPTTD